MKSLNVSVGLSLIAAALMVATGLWLLAIPLVAVDAWALWYVR